RLVSARSRGTSCEVGVTHDPSTSGAQMAAVLDHVQGQPIASGRGEFPERGVDPGPADLADDVIREVGASRGAVRDAVTVPCPERGVRVRSEPVRVFLPAERAPPGEDRGPSTDVTLRVEHGLPSVDVDGGVLAGVVWLEPRSSTPGAAALDAFLAVDADGQRVHCFGGEPASFVGTCGGGPVAVEG